MLVVSTLKMSGSTKKREQEHKNKIFCEYIRHFPIKGVTRKFHGATTTANKCSKKGAASAKSFFFWCSRFRHRLALRDVIFCLSKL